MKTADGARKSGTKGEEGLLSVFLRCRTALRRYILQLSGSADLAEDVAQEAFAKVFAAGPENLRSPRNLLFLTAHRLVIDHWRRTSVAGTDNVVSFEALGVQGGSGDPETHVLARERLRLLCEALERLPTQQRRVFTLRKVYGLSHREIADELGIAVSTVQKHLTKGIREIDAFLGRALGEEGSSLDPGGVIGKAVRMTRTYG